MEEALSNILEAEYRKEFLATRANVGIKNNLVITSASNLASINYNLQSNNLLLYFDKINCLFKFCSIFEKNERITTHNRIQKDRQFKLGIYFGCRIRKKYTI